MPQASVYLPDETNLPISDDVQRLNDLKPETWQLLLPSAIPEDHRLLCYKGVVETEQVLRLAQLQDSLVDLRRYRRALRNLQLYFKKNMAGEGQKTQTKSRTIETGVNSRIKRAVRRYRMAHTALLELDPNGDWKNEYYQLRDEDNRGPLKEADEMDTGDGRYKPSWIWGTSSAMILPGEGSMAEQQEVNETARYEWMTCQARADRWKEEEELLQEEMRRVVVYLEWKSQMWSDRVGIRVGLCTPDIQNGINAYAHRQSNTYNEIAVLFSSQWLPYLNACGLKTEWAKTLPWFSQTLFSKTKLPKRLPVILQDSLPDASHPPLTTHSSPAIATEAAQQHSYTNTIKGKSINNRREEHNEFSDGIGESSDDEEEGLDLDYEGGGYGGDDSNNDNSYDDGVETDGLGFEYEDDYMT